MGLDNSINSVSVTVTDWPYEITWSIGDDLCTGGPYPHDFAPPDNSGGDAGQDDSTGNAGQDYSTGNAGGDPVAIPEVTVTVETPLSVAEQENVRDAYCDTMQTVTGSDAIVCSITEVANRRRLLSVSYVLSASAPADVAAAVAAADINPASIETAIVTAIETSTSLSVSVQSTPEATPAAVENANSSDDSSGGGGAAVIIIVILVVVVALVAGGWFYMQGKQAKEDMMEMEDEPEA